MPKALAILHLTYNDKSFALQKLIALDTVDSVVEHGTAFVSWPAETSWAWGSRKTHMTSLQAWQVLAKLSKSLWDRLRKTCPGRVCNTKTNELPSSIRVSHCDASKYGTWCHRSKLSQKKKKKKDTRKTNDQSERAWVISNIFLMMILFVYVTVLSVLFVDEKLQFSQMG